MDNLIGKTLDGLYTVRELIGTGGMANVYKAVVGPGGPVPEGTVVAVKVLRQELMHDPDLVRRFKNESKAISLLNHPNIVKVYDVSVSEKLQYIVMEYVDGMTLREYLNERGGRLTSRETVHFISQILKALDHAHRNGVVHRDIKPQNIMLLDNGQLRMMDFGIARISRAENQLSGGKAMGSVHYISPEQAKGDETDFTSDIYSVGVMMYEMLSGHLPFDADDVVEVAIKQITDKPKSLQELAPTVPHGLVEITERAMAKRPENRYASAAEMLGALNAYVEDPSIVFNYTYLPDEIPEKVVEHSVKTKKEAPEPKKTRKSKKKKPIFLPVLFGITVAFALACMALCWTILNDSSTLMSEKADIVLADYSGMTQDEVNAQAVAGGGPHRPRGPERDPDHQPRHPVRHRAGCDQLSAGRWRTAAQEPRRLGADHPGRGRHRGGRLHHPHRPCRRQPGGGGLHRCGLCEPPAGQHHGQGAVSGGPVQRERCPHPAGAEQAGPGQHHRAVQRQACRYHHRAGPCRRFHRQGEQPRQRDRQRRARTCAGDPGRGARQHLGERQFQRQQLRRRLVERPCGRWLFLLQRLFRFQLRHQPERLVECAAVVTEES